MLENAIGRLSLWPVWREVPEGWSVRFGPAPHEVCAAHAGTGPVTGPTSGRPYDTGAAGPSRSTGPSAGSVRRHR
ncbi:MbtH family NRPS accessory protein [Streptomyces atroolivaceus]